MTCPHTHSDGAYVLGALSPAERSEYEAHLAGCEACRAAVARLAPVPGLLGRVDSSVLEPSPSGPGRLSQLLAEVAQQRRRQRWFRRFQLAAAVLLAVVLAVGGSVAWSGMTGGEPVPTAAMVPVAQDVDVTAQVDLEPATGGTEVRMACQYPDAAERGEQHVFRLFAVGSDGTREQVSSWLAGPGDEVSLTGMTHLSESELDRLELHGWGTELLVYDAP